ncbi:cysteine-rich CWC family protein [Cohnella yongneupensis]|uniref:Cysteine-rich CWC family protein n=1 Tax=Cohnella yongneupensis TaxID=425006 RepID=A0ABW0R547_9BACL
MNCPICGNDSGCGMEAGKAAEDCWCSKAKFPPRTLALVPGALRDKACICQSCLARAEEAGDNGRE